MPPPLGAFSVLVSFNQNSTKNAPKGENFIFTHAQFTVERGVPLPQAPYLVKRKHFPHIPPPSVPTFKNDQRLTICLKLEKEPKDMSEFKKKNPN